MIRILLVDDEPYVLLGMKKVLEGLSAEYIVQASATDGREALERLGSSTFDLVITDIRMPVMDGLELCRAASLQHPGIKLIVLSGFDEFEYARQAMRFGVKDFLLKPVDRQELRATLERVEAEIMEAREEIARVAGLVESRKEYYFKLTADFFRAKALGKNAEAGAAHARLDALGVEPGTGPFTVLRARLDEADMLLSGISLLSLPIQKAVLFGAAMEACADVPAWCFLDSLQDIAIITGTTQDMDALKAAVGQNAGTKLLWGCSSRVALEEICLGYRQAKGERDSAMLPGNARLAEELHAILREAAGSPSGADRHKAVAELTGKMMKLGTCERLRAAVWCAETICAEANRDFASVLESTQGNGRLDAAIASVDAAWVGSMLASAFGVNSDRIPGEAGEAMLMNKAVEYIRQNFSRQIGLVDAADHCGVSAGYLSAVFHRNGDESFIRYITRLRLEHAARLIVENPYEKVKTIGEKSGYPNPKHFQYLFKRAYNMTPGEMQESLRATV